MQKQHGTLLGLGGGAGNALVYIQSCVCVCVRAYIAGIWMDFGFAETLVSAARI